MSAGINGHAIAAIYKFEMNRTFRTIWQSIAAPVLTTTLYVVVFGAALGGRISPFHGVQYAAFVVPGSVMLAVLTQSVANASFGIYFPKFSGTIYEILSAPVGALEIVTAYVGAAASKSLILASISLITASFLVPLRIDHPLLMLAFLTLTAVSFSLFGFIIGIWADGFEKLQIIPLLVLTPLTFLGGTFFPLSVLPGIWKSIALVNPVVYLISGFRWAFFSQGDVNIAVSLAATLGFLTMCSLIVWRIFQTGWRLKN
jgi:ABC-2 type transport system permease protein